MDIINVVPAEVPTPGTEVPTPAVAVENPIVPNVLAPAAADSVVPPVGAAPAVGTEVPNVVAPTAPVATPTATTAGAAPSVETEVATIAKSELAHVFDAFEHASLMEGISRLYALAKKYL
jgi:hypothetical protein